MASDYEESMFGWGYCMPEAIADALVRHGGLQMEASILDLGCGNGLCGQALYNRGIKDINGIDFSRCVESTTDENPIKIHLRFHLPENIWEVHAISLLYEDVHFDRDFGGGYEKVEILGSIFLIKKWFEKKKCIFGEKRTLAALCFLKTNVIFFRSSTVLILPCTLCIIFMYVNCHIFLHIFLILDAF